MFERFNTLTVIEQDPYVVFCYVKDFSKDCVSMDCNILSKREGKNNWMAVRSLLASIHVQALHHETSFISTLSWTEVSNVIKIRKARNR